MESSYEHVGHACRGTWCFLVGGVGGIVDPEAKKLAARGQVLSVWRVLEEAANRLRIEESTFMIMCTSLSL